MTNIGIITQSHFPALGGEQIFNHNLATELHNQNIVQPTVICSPIKNINHKNLYDYNCFPSKNFSYLTNWLYNKNINYIVQKRNVKLLHGSMLHGGGFSALKYGKKYNIPTLAVSHGSDVQSVPEIGYGAINSKYANNVIEVIENIDHLVAVSKMNMKNMVQLGADPDKITVINNGINLKPVENLKIENIRGNFNCDDEDFLITFVGRNSPIKRVSLLFKALKILKEYKKIKCVIVGPEGDMKDLIIENQIMDKVILLGTIPKKFQAGDHLPHGDLINIYKNSNIYISTSYAEAFGGTALEALACGTPIICGKYHGINDVVKNGFNGYMMKNDEPEELANIILTLYKEKNYYKSIRKKIQNTVRHLDWPLVAERYTKLYQKLIIN